jgi:hypothetical protein
MAKDPSKKKWRLKRAPDPDQEEQARVRQELGIQALPEGESLMNTQAFSRLQIDAALSQARADGGVPPADEPDDELMLEEITTELPVRGQGHHAATRVPADPAEVAALEREMMAAKERDDVAELALRIATYYAKAAAIFVVNNGIVAGLRSAGEGSTSGIEAVMIPADAQSVICTPVATRKFSRGTPQGEVDGRVLRAMGRSSAKEILALPVAIGERVVNVIYADNGAESLPDTSVGALRVLALTVAKAYERLILERNGRRPE